ncbi:MAG: LamG domain-containing protein [Acidobacteria bacterium]|nr:LamG domain-containing protein [Acidobacteriota bacterium]
MRAATFVKCFVAVLVMSSLTTGKASAQSCVTPPSGLIAWWPGDGNAKDIKNGNDGTLVGNTTFAPGIVGDAFGFALSAKSVGTDYVQVANHRSLHVERALTIDAWINPSVVGPVQTILSKAGEISGTKTGYSFAVVPAKGILYFWLFRTTGPADISAPFAPGRWAHATAWFNGNELRIYIDGALASSRVVAPDTIATAEGELNIGRNALFSSDFFDGQVDEVELFNRALDDKEVAAIFEAGRAGKCKDSSIKVSIDIKPGSFPNSINLSNAGTVPVAIFSSEAFDATQIDPETVSLAGASVKMVGKSGKYLCSAEDVNQDGRLDLVCHVLTAQFMIEPGDSVATLEALTFDGRRVRGEDTVRIVPD